MLFLVYWELNENVSEQERLTIAQKLTSAGLHLPEGVHLIRWDITPDSWGVTTLEANKAEDVFRTIAVWRASAAGFFKSIKTAPALPVDESMALAAKTLQALASI